MKRLELALFSSKNTVLANYKKILTECYQKCDMFLSHDCNLQLKADYCMPLTVNYLFSFATDASISCQLAKQCFQSRFSQPCFYLYNEDKPFLDVCEDQTPSDTGWYGDVLGFFHKLIHSNLMPSLSNKSDIELQTPKANLYHIWSMSTFMSVMKTYFWRFVWCLISKDEKHIDE